MRKTKYSFIDLSTHYVVDAKGELKILTLCNDLRIKSCEEVLLAQQARMYNKLLFFGYNDCFK